MAYKSLTGILTDGNCGNMFICIKYLCQLRYEENRGKLVHLLISVDPDKQINIGFNHVQGYAMYCIVSTRHMDQG